MTGTRSGVPQPPTFIAADDRIPFPATDQVLRCRTEPDLFALEDVHNTAKEPRAREKTLAQAKHACSGCPIVTGCLKWALANPDLTKNWDLGGDHQTRPHAASPAARGAARGGLGRRGRRTRPAPQSAAAGGPCRSAERP